MKTLLTLLIFITPIVVGASIGNPKAPKGGTFKYNLGQEPTTLNPLSSTDIYATRVQNQIVENLARRNVETFEWEPALATSWTISKDGTVFDVELRKGVKWHDGKPFTAEDVKFSFDAIKDPKNRYSTAHQLPYYTSIKSIEVVGPHKIKIKTQSKYFKNFEIIMGSLDILPKHIYQDTSKKNKRELNKTVVGSGPYKFKSLKKGKYIELVRNKDWWGYSDKDRAGEYNYDKILMRFISDGTMAITRAAKGDLDFLGLSAEEFVKKTNGPRWGKTIKKVKFQNKAPKGYGFIAFNLNDPKFKSKNVRKAIYHLLDREKMIDKFQYGFSLPATGPWYRQSVYADQSIKPILYDAKKAKSLFEKEGWKDTDGDKILDKVIDGKKVKMSITLMEPSEEFMKYLTIFKEDAKKQGVEINLKRVEWNTFVKLLDEKKFEMVRLGWSGGYVDVDPKQIWHSSSAQAGGSNFNDYKNPEVDKLIDEAREIFDKNDRIKLMQQVYRKIADDVPYMFLFNEKFGFYGYSSKMGREKDTYTYGINYMENWWLQK